MKQILSIILIFLTLNLFGQKAEIEELINQIAAKEVPENFDYYFLIPKSMEQPKIYDSLQNYQIRELKMIDKNFPLKLIYEQGNNTINWKNYDLKKVEYVSDEYVNRKSPPTKKSVRFVKYNINKKEYDSLTKNRKPHTLIIKKKWIWNKNRILENKKFHNELIKAWDIDEENNREEKIYFQFSKPIFSKDEKYAKISIFKSQRCKGNGFTALYRNENGTWKKLIEFNQLDSKVSMSHTKCGDISISYSE